MELPNRTGTQWVIRRVSDGMFLRSADGTRYREEVLWTDTILRAHTIRYRAGLSLVFNRMRRSTLRGSSGSRSRPWTAVQNGKVSEQFRPEEFQVEEIELRTTGRTVAF